MRPTVYIHTNHKQHIGALVSAHSMRRNSRHAEKFDVELIELKDYEDFFKPYEGRDYLRDGVSRTWLYDDLQSFTPLRFTPPERMGYAGRTSGNCSTATWQVRRSGAATGRATRRRR